MIKNSFNNNDDLDLQSAELLSPDTDSNLGDLITPQLTTKDMSLGSKPDLATNIGTISQVAREEAYRYFQDFTSRTNWQNEIDDIFGTSYSAEALNEIVSELHANNLTNFPKIQIIDADSLQGANGGYNSRDSLIYLADTFLADNLNNLSAVTKVVLEEVGHFIDAEINLEDSPGDEGEKFVKRLFGEEFNVGLLAEDDTKVITVNEKQVTIEQSNEDLAGNSLATARDLGTFTGTQTFKDSVSSQDRNDYYKFNLDTAGTVNFALTGLSANANIVLLDSTGKSIIGSWRPGTKSEYQVAENLDAGDYYLRVVRWWGNTSYDLSLTFDGAGDNLAAARDLGSFTGTQSFKDSISSQDRNDYYKFNLDTSGEIKFALTGLSANANIVLLDSAGKSIIGSWRPGTRNEYQVKEDLDAGDYYLRVIQKWGRTNYNLSLVFDGAGDNLAAARDLGSFTGTQSFKDSISSQDRNDYYKFNLDTSGEVRFALTGLSANANIVLLDSQGDNIIGSWKPGTRNEFQIAEDLSAGDYYLRVVSWGGKTNYDLSVSFDSAGDNLSAARDLGSFTGVRVFQDNVNSQDPNDYYKFNLDTSGKITFALVGLNANANVILKDNTGANIIGSWESGTKNEYQTAENLPAGDYYLQVLRQWGHTNYSLGIDITSYPQITIASLNDGKPIELGQEASFDWIDNIDQRVDVDLYLDGTFLEKIAFQTSSDGRTNWTIPTDLPLSDRYQVRVYQSDNDTIDDLSDFFSIQTSDLKKYWFYYNYEDGNLITADSYHGSVIAPSGKYTVGQSYNHRTSNNETGNDGIYSIYEVEDYDDSLANEAGRVFIDTYYDRDNPAAIESFPVKTFALEDSTSIKEFVPFKYANGIQPSGTNYLGSELDYVEDEGYITNRFGQDYYEADPIEFPQDYWKAEYFNGRDFSQAPAYIENLGAGTQDLSLRWDLESPNPAVNNDNFAARITTKRFLEPGLHQIQTSSDDGIQVKIDGAVILNQWKIQPFDSHSGYFYSEGKEYDVEIKYFEQGGGAALDFNIAKAEKFLEPTDETKVWRASIYSWDSKVSDRPPQDFFAGGFQNSPKAIASIDLGSNTRSDGRTGASFNWGTGAIKGDNRLPHDNFVIRAYTHKHLEAGKIYKAWVRGDDGFQLFAHRWHTNYDVDIIKNRQGQPTEWESNYGGAKPYEFTVSHTGMYDLHFHMFENGGDANFDFMLEEPNVPAEILAVSQQYELGHATSAVIHFNSEVTYQTFKCGSVVNSPYGTYPLFGGIRQRYLDTGGLNGNLGAPKTGEIGLGNGIVRQEFANGYIIWNGSSAQEYYGDAPNSNSSEANIVNGYFLPANYYNVWNRDKGTIGNPTSEVTQFSSSTSFQIFTAGSVVSSEHGTYPLFGGIRGRYLETGGLNGRLGAPKTGEIGLGNGIIRQEFANGYIIWDGSSAEAFYNGNDNGNDSTAPINLIDFSGRVMPAIGVAIRNSPNLEDKNGEAIAYNQTVSFDGWTTGETAIDTQLRTPDNRWFRIAGTDTWVPSAYIFGNPEGYPEVGVDTNTTDWELPLPAGSFYISQGIRPGHVAIDLAANQGLAIEAAKSGEVVLTAIDQFGGKYIDIDHGGGIKTRYLHLSEFNVSEGDTVTNDTVIGKVGSTGNSTGPHLHFEVFENGVRQDPRNYIDFNNFSSSPDSEDNLVTAPITYISFSGSVMPTIGVQLRNSPRLNDRSNEAIAFNEIVEFDAWTTGQTATDTLLRTPDNRWFRVKGTSYWVPSAYINGNPRTEQNIIEPESPAENLERRFTSKRTIKVGQRSASSEFGKGNDFRSSDFPILFQRFKPSLFQRAKLASTQSLAISGYSLEENLRNALYLLTKGGGFSSYATEFVDRFMSGIGGTLIHDSNSRLSSIAENTDAVKNFVNLVKDNFENIIIDQITNEGINAKTVFPQKAFSISNIIDFKIEEEEFKNLSKKNIADLDLLDVAFLPFNTINALQDLSLFALIGGTQGTDVFVKNFAATTKLDSSKTSGEISYSGVIRLEIYDDFGVDESDLYESLAGTFAGSLYSFWILQHQRFTPKPFVNKIIVEVPINGKKNFTFANT